jgi:hypothetical protein
MTRTKTADFLKAMQQGGDPADQLSTTVRTPPAARVSKTPPYRVGLRHFGGYLDEETLEKIALLRVRLKVDNAALIKQAIDELHRKLNAKRAFGDG